MVKKKSKSKKYLIVVLVVLIVAGLGGARMMSMKNATTYLSVTVKTGDVQTYYTFSGSVASESSQTVMADTVMQIETIEFDEGDKVESGDVLFTTTAGGEIIAGIDGTIDEIYVDVDDQIISGTSLCQIIDFENLQLEVKIDEYALSCISEGDETLVYIGAIDKDIDASVQEISNTAQSANGVAYFTAILELEYDEDIKVGMSAETKLLNSQALDALLLDMDAVDFDDDDNAFVYLLNDEGEYEETIIETGVTDGVVVEVISGLDEDQEVYYIEESSSSSSPFDMMSQMRG